MKKYTFKALVFYMCFRRNPMRLRLDVGTVLETFGRANTPMMGGNVDNFRDMGGCNVDKGHLWIATCWA